MLKVFVLVISLQSSGGAESVTVVDNISTPEQCQSLGERLARFHGDGDPVLRWACFDVEKVR